MAGSIAYHAFVSLPFLVLVLLVVAAFGGSGRAVVSFTEHYLTPVERPLRPAFLGGADERARLTVEWNADERAGDDKI